MTTHSIADARNNLSELIGRAEKGEEIVITRHGQPVAKISSLPRPAPKATSDEALTWLLEHPPVGSVMPEEDAGTFVSRMRDEDWAR